MIRDTKLFIQSPIPRGAGVFAKAREKFLSSFHGDTYVRDVFSRIYRYNAWHDPESRSGRCATREATNIVRRELPLLLKKLDVRSILDAPCGDFNWMQHTKLPVEKYIGADVVPELIRSNRDLYMTEGREFRVIDITRDEIPTVDLIFCRDCLIHLSLKYMQSAIANFKKSRSKYLLTTTYTTTSENKDILTGDCRFINLQIEPFNFPEPLELIIEEPETGKSMGLWRLDAL